MKAILYVLQLNKRDPPTGDTMVEMNLDGKIIGHVRIERLLAQGGMGSVYLGVDERLGRRVAVKALTTDRRFDPEARARFLREARLLSQLDDPGICRIFDLIEDEDADYLILELIDGVTLSDAVEAIPDEAGRLRLFLGVARALAVEPDFKEKFLEALAFPAS